MVESADPARKYVLVPRPQEIDVIARNDCDERRKPRGDCTYDKNTHNRPAYAGSTRDSLRYRSVCGFHVGLLVVPLSSSLTYEPRHVKRWPFTPADPHLVRPCSSAHRGRQAIMAGRAMFRPER